MAKEKILGIDLGTTNSCLAVIEGDTPAVISNSEGKRTTPSIVSFAKKGKGERQVGDVAKRQAITNPTTTIYAIKRFMGKKFSQVKHFVDEVPYKVVQGPKDSVLIEIGERKYTPQEISAMVLQKIKSAAEEFLGTSVKKAVITVPAYFNDAERQATKEAGQIAGLEVERIINEPTAAALGYGLDKLSDKDKDMQIAVFDLGGGTFDISILDMGGGVFEVKSTNGDLSLGGDNFDQEIIEWLADSFQKEQGVNLRKDPTATQRLKDAAEKAKIELSQGSSTEINLPYITAIDNVPKHLVLTLTRAKFESLIDPYVAKLEKLCRKALADAKMNIKEIDEVLLVGGSTRIPRIQQIASEIFGKKPSKGVNPDEVVAIGAAVQGGILQGDLKDVVLLDVIPLNLGIETMGGIFTSIIDANTTIPTKKSQIFSTAEDNQPGVDVMVYQGNSSMAKSNRLLGACKLTNLAPAPRGVPQIEVTFDIDANGILSVYAKDKATGKEQQVRIEGSSNLSKKEIERMKQEAEKNATEDKKQLERAQKLNEADAMTFQAEKQLKELKNKLTKENQERIQKEVEALKIAHKSADLQAVEEAMKPLKKSIEMIQKQLLEELQKKQTAGEGASSSTKQATKDEQVSDVSFEEVKEEEEDKKKK